MNALQDYGSDSESENEGVSSNDDSFLHLKPIPQDESKPSMSVVLAPEVAVKVLLFVENT